VKRQKIIVVVGPTASGKSELAVKLAKKFNGEIISADSRQVYKGLDIGTGKITNREMKGIPHHLLNVISPRGKFSVHDFIVRARKTIDDIVTRGKIPIIAGGTGFYIDAFVGRTIIPNIPADISLRKKLEMKTSAQLLTILQKKNPKRANEIIKKNEQNNKRRIIRAIEVATKLTECPRVTLGHSLKYDVFWIGIEVDRKKLREKIHERLIERLRRGMVDEAKNLHAHGLSYKRMEDLGLEYRYLARFLRKKISKDEMIEQLSAKIWQYARRQMTYWRRNINIHWFAPKQMAKAEQLVSSFLKS
jgi:tRNA dimethylallyltransferase